jgi:poly-gamma-glutamate synthesis protein (capsule biosynthesis protein)
MRGIEIRYGKPIFYSLGNFIFQNETVFKMPAAFYKRYNLDPYSGKVSTAYDKRHNTKPRPGYQEQKWFTKDEKYWISVLPKMEFKDNKLEKLVLYPIELGQEKTRSQRGRPMLADKSKGEKILGIIQKLSKPYGTEIEIRENLGIIEV